MKEQKISHLEGDAERGLRRIVFDNGSEISREGLFYGLPQRQSSDLAEALGCEIGAMEPFPAVVEGNPTTRETTVPGVYVAGTPPPCCKARSWPRPPGPPRPPSPTTRWQRRI